MLPTTITGAPALSFGNRPRWYIHSRARTLVPYSDPNARASNGGSRLLSYHHGGGARSALMPVRARGTASGAGARTVRRAPATRPGCPAQPDCLGRGPGPGRHARWSTTGARLPAWFGPASGAGARPSPGARTRFPERARERVGWGQRVPVRV